MKEYKGTLNSTKVSGAIKKAFDLYCAQLTRCNCKTNGQYHRYGARGIKVEYTSRQFIAWYLENMPENAKPREFHVGRKDHDKNYTLDNIEIQTASENSREVHDRHPKIIKYNMTNRAKKKPVDIYMRDTGKFFARAEGVHEAAYLTSNHAASVCMCCKGKLKGTRNGFTFRHTGEGL